MTPTEIEDEDTKITIRRPGKLINRLNIHLECLMRKIRTFIVVVARVEMDNFVMFYDGTLIEDDATFSSLSMNETDVLRAFDEIKGSDKLLKYLRNTE